MTIRHLRILTTALLAGCTLLGAVAASAQTTPVAIQMRQFASHGDGSSGPGAFPCCVGPQTYDARTVSSQHPPNTMNRGGPYFSEMSPRRQYGVADVQTTGTVASMRSVVVPDDIYDFSNMLPLLTLPGGNLVAIETSFMFDQEQLTFAPAGGIAAGPGGPAAGNISQGDFSASAISQGNLFFEYNADNHEPTNVPTFRAASTWVAPTGLTVFAGRIRVTPSADQYGGVRDMLWQQLSHGFNKGPTTATLAEFNFPVRYGPGVALPATFDYNFALTTTSSLFTLPNASFMASDVVRRSTSDAPFTVRVTPGTMGNCCTGAPVFSSDGTGWFDMVDYTTGTLQILANTLGTIFDDFSTRTEMGSYALGTSGGEITGQIQLVSGALLNSRGATISNLAHTHNTLIKFAPEPGSAALIGAGALGLIGMAIRDRKNRA